MTADVAEQLVRAGEAALAHPEFAQERLHLGATIEAIDGWMQRPLKQATGTGDEDALLAMERYRAWRRIQLREALQSPYFARIDFVPEDTRQRGAYYIGKTFFEGDGVKITAWQAPVAALFYRSTSSQAAYDAPEGRIRGTLELKRRLVIDHGVLTHIADDLDERPPAQRAAAAELPVAPSRDDLLRAILAEGASPWLRDIIATIQADQYALIVAPANQVLVVQGVAGSGKTSIAVHRLSYLVYPALLGARIPPRCLVFGPNQLFLKYVSAVLPKLGLQHVVQTTLADWSLARMGLERMRRTDATFDALLDARVPQAEKDALYRRSRLKTSRRMGTLLERYVEWRRHRVRFPDQEWTLRVTVQKTVGTVTLERQVPVEELRARHTRFADKRLAVHRAMFAESVLTYANTLFETNAQGEQADAEAQLALGKRRLEQAKGLREEAERLRTGRPSTVVRPSAAPAGPRPASSGASPRFGEAPAFGSTPLPRQGSGSSFGSPAVASGAGGGEALRQQIRQLELAADRRQQEGEELVQAAEAALAGILTPAYQEQVRRRVREQVAGLVDRHWQMIDAQLDYYALLNDEPLLRELAAGIFAEDEVALLAGSASPTRNAVDLSDLPAIHYLFVISQGPEEVGRTIHDFVVVDEAQDVAELDLHCLRLLERRQSFTLLGDLSQSIYGHRGLTNWRQAEAIFTGPGGVEESPYQYEECGVSYRTTAEITQVANKVLRSLALTPGPSPKAGEGSIGLRGVGGQREALAFDRHGPEPVLAAAADEAALVAAVKEAVAQARERRYASVAVITKTAARARELGERLAEGGVGGVTLIDRPEDVEFRGGAVVLPVYLAKGLEFDAAVVVDANALSYAANAFDARLLYVALTRAMHDLRVLWIGGSEAITPHLAG